VERFRYITIKTVFLFSKKSPWRWPHEGPKHTGNHTYLLTPWWRVLLEKLTGFPAFHGIRRFIIALTNVRHLSLSWASPIQSIYPHPTSWRSILIRIFKFEFRYIVVRFTILRLQHRGKKKAVRPVHNFVIIWGKSVFFSTETIFSHCIPLCLILFLLRI